MSYDKSYLESIIRTIPDWPEVGIQFRDITPLFKDPKSLQMIADSLYEKYKNSSITHIVSIDARGFIMGSVLAYKLQLPLVLARKKGKLPGETINQSYQLEYGVSTIEMHADALTKGDKVLIFDDLIATGGTILATTSLVDKLGATTEEVATLIDLPELKGSELIKKKGISVHTLISYDGK